MSIRVGGCEYQDVVDVSIRLGWGGCEYHDGVGVSIRVGWG